MLSEGSIQRNVHDNYGIRFDTPELRKHCKQTLTPYVEKWACYYGDYFIVQLKVETAKAALQAMEKHCIYSSPMAWNRHLIWVGEQSTQEHTNEGSRVDQEVRGDDRG